MDIFSNPTVKERLEQGKSEPIIKGILGCSTVKEIRSYLVKAVLDDPSVVDVINRYLKRIVVKSVKLSDSGGNVSNAVDELVKLGVLRSYEEEQVTLVDTLWVV